MIRLQARDIDILRDIGICQIMTYSQIRKLHFPTYQSCIKRIGALQREKLIHGSFYNTEEKVFILTKEGVKILNDIAGEEYKIGEYGNLFHKIMRSELYCNIKHYGITDWKNEALIQETGKIYDSSFEYKESLYLVEVHNEQKTKVLKEKLIDSLKIGIDFTLIVYTKNNNPVNSMIEKMNSKGFDKDRKYKLKVVQLGCDIEL